MDRSQIKTLQEDAAASSMVYDFTLAKNIGEHLTKKYPGHLWKVVVNQGVVFIHNLMLSGNWGFTIKQEHIDNDYIAITKAGGELLERYRISRGRLKEQEVLDMPRDFAARPIGDMSK